MIALALQHDEILDDENVSDLLALAELEHERTYLAADDPRCPHARTLAADFQPSRRPSAASQSRASA